MDAHPGPAPDKDAVIQWFMRNTGTGKPAAQQMAAFYMLLCEADISGAEQDPAPNARASRAPTTRQKRAVDRPKPVAPSVPATVPAPTHPQTAKKLASAFPNLHIDIQVHISADASAEQIDQVFASMAKHLYGR